MLCDRLAVSERWACRVVGQHRSTQRREAVIAGDDQALRAALREIAVKRPSVLDRLARERGAPTLVDDVQELDRAAVDGLVELEVDRPHVMCAATTGPS